MSQTTQAIITVVITIAVVSLCAYFFGFAMLFAHTAAEAFYYGLLYGLSAVVVLGLKAWYQSAKQDVPAGSLA